VFLPAVRIHINRARPLVHTPKCKQPRLLGELHDLLLDSLRRRAPAPAAAVAAPAAAAAPTPAAVAAAAAALGRRVPRSLRKNGLFF
jgi:hypothetical protein